MSPTPSTLHWFSCWPDDGTAPALADLDPEAGRAGVVAWHALGAPRPPGLAARALDAPADAMRALNDGVAVFDLRSATAEHAWIAALATSVPGILLLAAPRWHAVTGALPGGAAARLHLLHEEHGAAGIAGARALRTGARTGDAVDAELPLGGWLARRSLAVLADPDDPRGAIPADLRVPVHPLPTDPIEVVRTVQALAADAGPLRRRVAANLSSDRLGAVVRRWVVTPPAAAAAFDRGTRSLRALYGADA